MASPAGLRRLVSCVPPWHWIHIFRYLIAHGLFDLVTPYFATQLLLDQIPAETGGDRIRLEVYPGGHMFYSRDPSRAAFRNAAQALFEAH